MAFPLSRRERGPRGEDRIAADVAKNSRRVIIVPQVYVTRLVQREAPEQEEPSTPFRPVFCKIRPTESGPATGEVIAGRQGRSKRTIGTSRRSDGMIVP